MPRRRGLGNGIQLESDFVAADLDMAFALLFAAEMHSLGEDRTGALRAIDEAENAIIDGQRRLPSLDDSDRERLRGQLTRVRAVIDGIRMNLRLAPEPE
jgi:hypothetical protein